MRFITLYKTPSPGLSIASGHFYELALYDNPDGFVLKEYHGIGTSLGAGVSPDLLPNLLAAMPR
jgi:hypothetical protein